MLGPSLLVLAAANNLYGHDDGQRRHAATGQCRRAGTGSGVTVSGGVLDKLKNFAFRVSECFPATKSPRRPQP